MRVAVAVGLVVGLVAVVGPPWRVARAWVTLAHELGHALAAIVAEGRVRRIRVDIDTSGVTEWSGVAVERRVARGFVAWWGHPAPGLLAVALAVGVAADRPVPTAVALCVALVLVTVVWIRSAWGLVVTGSVAAAAGAGAAWGAPAAAGVVAATAALWAVGGLRAAGHAARHARRGDGSDQATLAAVLWLPVRFWAVTMVVVAAAGVVATGAVLAPLVTG